MTPREIAMSKKSGLPRYVTADQRRDGTPFYVLRRPGQPKVTLPSPALSEAFWSAYAAAMGGKALPPPERPTRAARSAAGTLSSLFDAYLRSSDVRNSAQLTQDDKRGVLEGILEEPLVPGEQLLFRTCPITSVTRRHVEAIRDRKATLPNAANKRLRYMRMAFDWAIGEELCQINPVDKVKRLRAPGGGFHTWSVDEIRAYEARHPVGTRARLGLALMAFAGLRISDLAQVGRQHVRDGWLVFHQHKNRMRKPKTIEIPILPALASIIAASPCGDLTFLVTDHGQPFSIKGIGGRVKDWCRQAGIPHCSAHGVRKAGATIAAENGATEAQLMAIFGWEGAKEVVTYTRRANRRKLAGEAMHLLQRREQS